MSKKLCSQKEDLKAKVKGKKKKYLCTKCMRKSPKDKWLCKPEKIKR